MNKYHQGTQQKYLWNNSVGMRTITFILTQLFSSTRFDCSHVNAMQSYSDVCNALLSK